MWLVADIGGTKTELGLYHPSIQNLTHVTRYENVHYSGIEAIMMSFFETVSCKKDMIQHVLLAVAGPVEIDEQGSSFVQFTNLSWKIKQDALQKIFLHAQIQLFNDFYVVTAACVMWAKQLSLGAPCSSVISLTPKQQIQYPKEMVVLGAGTGLGQAFAVPTKIEEMQIIPTEGGHMDFAPRTFMEMEILSFLQSQKEGYASYGHILCGSGMELLYHFFQKRSLTKQHPHIQKWFEQQNSSHHKSSLAALISSLALQKQDPICEQVLACFVQIYGAFASNLAVQLFPQGGIFLAGGIAPKILPALQNGIFLQRFHDRKPFRERCEKIPIYVVVEPSATLWGGIFLLQNFK